VTAKELEMELLTLKAAHRQTTLELVKTQQQLFRAEHIIDALLAAREGVSAGMTTRMEGDFCSTRGQNSK
jgi:hypothetical protein